MVREAKNPQISPCVDTFDKALVHVALLMGKEAELLNSDEIHSAKSILYAAIERVGTKAERVVYSQRLLRELFSLVSESCNLREHERRLAIQIIHDLKTKYREEI